MPFPGLFCARANNLLGSSSLSDFRAKYIYSSFFFYFRKCAPTFRRGVTRVTRKRTNRYYRVAIYASGTPSSKKSKRKRNGGGKHRRRKSRSENLCTQNNPIGSFGDYPCVTYRTARGQSKQVASLHFARSEGRTGREKRKERQWPRAIARRVSVIKPGVMVI